MCGLVRESPRGRARRRRNEPNRPRRSAHNLPVAAGSARVSVGPAQPLAREDRPMLRLGIVTYNIAKDWDLPTILKRLEALGYRGGRAADRRTPTRSRSTSPTAERRRGQEAVRRLARRARRARQRLRVPGDRPGGRQQEHRGDEGVRPAGPRHRLAGREGPAQRHPQGGRPRRHAPPDRPGPARGRRGRRRASASRSASRSTAAPPSCCPTSPRSSSTPTIPTSSSAGTRTRPTSIDGSIRENFALVGPEDPRGPPPRPDRREVPLARALRPARRRRAIEGYTLAEIPESPDPERVLRYFRALWLAYQPRPLSGPPANGSNDDRAPTAASRSGCRRAGRRAGRGWPPSSPSAGAPPGPGPGLPRGHPGPRRLTSAGTMSGPAARGPSDANSSGT